MIFIPFDETKVNKNAKPYENKDKILSFFKNGKEYAIAPTFWYDMFTNEKVGDDIFTYTDGKYEWSCYIPYYIEKYNYRLEKEYEDMILNELAIRELRTIKK